MDNWIDVMKYAHVHFLFLLIYWRSAYETPEYTHWGRYWGAN